MSLPHLVDGDGQPLCPEAAELDALDDGAFWERVLNGRTDEGPDVDEGEPEREVADLGVCPVCAELGACGYDAEGRPMIHTTDEDEVEA